VTAQAQPLAVTINPNTGDFPGTMVCPFARSATGLRSAFWLNRNRPSDSLQLNPGNCCKDRSYESPR
jgi:hypothetical protein